MFLRPKSVQQAAALPFVPIGTGMQVLMITSRRRGRWIVPKGWPMRGRSLPEAAAHEAVEEAGVEGVVSPEPIGSYRYLKETREGYDIRCHVFVYPLLVLHHRVDWRERAERELRWFALAEAAEFADDRGLAKLIARLAAADGGPLRQLHGRLTGGVAA